MRDVLITGGSGKIGFDLVKKLIDTNYSITILDLESKDSLKKLFKLRNKVKIVYGDIEDANLIRDLVMRNDIVIDYAGIMPPLANLNEEIAQKTNFLGTKNIVDAINETNPDCTLIYMSFISFYGTTSKAKRILSADTESTHPDDYYSVSIIKSEEYIRSNLKNFTIIRMPIVLTRKNYFINHLKLGKTVDFITIENLNDIVIKVMFLKSAYGKTYNVSGFKVKSDRLIERLYKTTGNISIINRNIYYGEFDNTKEIDKIIKIEYTNFEDAFSSIKKKTHVIKAVIKQIINFPKYLIFKIMSSKSK